MLRAVFLLPVTAMLAFGPVALAQLKKPPLPAGRDPGGVAIGVYTPAEARSAWNAAVELLAQAGARPVIDQVLPFDQLPAAFERLQLGASLRRPGQETLSLRPYL